MYALGVRRLCALCSGITCHERTLVIVVGLDRGAWIPDVGVIYGYLGANHVSR